MARELTLPKLGENIDTAIVVEVLIKAGDRVTTDQPLFSLETDKAEFELPSTLEGTVAEILVKEGDEVRMGQALLRIEEGGKAAAAPAAKAQEPERQEAKPAAPKRSEDEDDAPAPPTKAPKGRAAKPPPPKAEEAEEAEEVQEAEGDDEAAPGENEAEQAQAPPSSPRSARVGRDHEEEAEPAPAQPASAAASGAAPVNAAPSVRRLARELGVDIAKVAGSGAGGRISDRDVQRHARALLRPEREAAAPASEEGGSKADRDAFGAIEREPIGRIRMRIAERMTEGWTTIPHVTHQDEADVTELERLREQFATRVARSGGKLTMTAILLKTLGSALRKFPRFNASLELEEGTILYHRYVHVAVAVDTDRGLVAPVIRNVDEKNIMQIARALGEIAERARGRALTPELLEGATFTLSNLGGIGGGHFSPIITPPQVAVLGVGRSAMAPCWVVDRFEPRRKLPLSLSYDHRLIDGADAARFVRWLCEALEEPFVMDLEGA